MATPYPADPRRPIRCAVGLGRALGILWGLAALAVGVALYLMAAEAGDPLVRFLMVLFGGLGLACLLGSTAFLVLAWRLAAGRAWAAVGLVVLGIANGLVTGARVVPDVGAVAADGLGAIGLGGAGRVGPADPWVSLFSLVALIASVALVAFAALSVRAVRAVRIARDPAADRRAGFEPVFRPPAPPVAAATEAAAFESIRPARPATPEDAR